VATVFSSLASKLVATVFSSLALKLVATVFSSLASKLVPTVSHQFGPQNRWRRFVSGLASKPLKQFRRFGLKTGGDGFWRFGLKPATTVSGGLASKPAATISGGLASKPAVTVFLFGLKIGGYGLVIWTSKSP
jgi:uncharacterized protein YjeT (DUF2065 family)